MDCSQHKMVLVFMFILGCSAPKKATENSAYTLDASGYKVEYTVDSILKNLNKWGTVSHSNFDSLNKIYHFKTAVLRHDTVFIPR